MGESAYGGKCVWCSVRCCCMRRYRLQMGVAGVVRRNIWYTLYVGNLHQTGGIQH